MLTCPYPYPNEAVVTVLAAAVVALRPLLTAHAEGVNAEHVVQQAAYRGRGGVGGRDRS